MLLILSAISIQIKILRGRVHYHSTFTPVSSVLSLYLHSGRVGGSRGGLGRDVGRG